MSRAGTSPLRWGVLGAGRVAGWHTLPALRGHADAVPVAIAASRPGAAAKLAAEFDISTVYDDYATLLADPRVDAVYLALPTGLHSRWAIAALSAGKHVLAEKPLATSVAQVDLIAAAASRTGRLIVEGFMYRTHPQFIQLLKLVGDGAIGTVRAMRGALSFVLEDPGDIRMSQPLGGGALLDLGCYPVDAAVAIYGGAPTAGAGVSTTEHGVDTHSTGVLEFGAGRTAVVEASFRLPWLGSPLEVRGDGGTLLLPDAFNPGTAPTQLRHIRVDGSHHTVEFSGTDMFAAQIDAFTAAVRGERPVPDLSASRAVQLGLALLDATAAPPRAIPSKESS